MIRAGNLTTDLRLHRSRRCERRQMLAQRFRFSTSWSHARRL